MNDVAPPASWRHAAPDDLDAIMALQDEVHALLPERREVFAAKMRLFGDGCLVLDGPGGVCGYGVSHPWRLGDVPPLDTIFDAWPVPSDCLFVHDVALQAAARGQGAGRAFVRHAVALARRDNVPALALVSVYGTVPIWGRCGFAVSGQVPPGKLAAYGDTARYMTAPL